MVMLSIAERLVRNCEREIYPTHQRARYSIFSKSNPIGIPPIEQSFLVTNR